MDCVHGFGQLFIRRGSDGLPSLFTVKLSDYILMPGSIDEMKEFVRDIRTRFKISKSFIDYIIHSN